MADLIFAFTVAKHVKSNAIVYAKGGATVGIGAGQMSRVDAARMAAWKGEAAAKEAGAIRAPDGGCGRGVRCFLSVSGRLQVVAEAGATAVIQPGGSLRDDEVIAAADEQASPWSSPACATSATRRLRGRRTRCRSQRPPSRKIRLVAMPMR